MWGEHERVHVQNMHANDRYQNVTEHKPLATVHETKSTDIGYAQHRNWVRLASLAGMSRLVCMVAACIWDMLTLRLHCHCLL